MPPPEDTASQLLFTADQDAVITTAEDMADTLSGELLTERQLLAYLLRDIAGLDRRPSLATSAVARRTSIPCNGVLERNYTRRGGSFSSWTR